MARGVALTGATKNRRAENSCALIAGWGSPRTYLLKKIARHEERWERAPERFPVGDRLLDRKLADGNGGRGVAGGGRAGLELPVRVGSAVQDEPLPHDLAVRVRLQ